MKLAGSARAHAVALQGMQGTVVEVEVNGRHTIVTDEPEGLGGTDQGPAPHELEIEPADLARRFRAEAVAQFVRKVSQREASTSAR